MDPQNEKPNNTAGSDDPLVTVIVPVYQVYQYLSECVESLTHQTYANLEILLIDDGSTDGSGALCDEYARMDARILVIHQENQGPSGARNTGLDYANGEYVAFVDSDDSVVPVYIEKLYRLLRKYHADIAACAYLKDSDNGSRYIARQIESCVKTGHRHKNTLCMSSEQMLRQWHGRYKHYETVVWNKLYHISVFNGDKDKAKIRYPKRKRDEDMLISHLIVENADRIALTTQVLYRYRSREGSITARTAWGEGVRDNLGAQRERMEFFRKKRYLRAYLNLWIGYVLHRVWFALLCSKS